MLTWHVALAQRDERIVKHSSQPAHQTSRSNFLVDKKKQKNLRFHWNAASLNFAWVRRWVDTTKVVDRNVQRDRQTTIEQYFHRHLSKWEIRISEMSKWFEFSYQWNEVDDAYDDDVPRHHQTMQMVVHLPNAMIGKHKRSNRFLNLQHVWFQLSSVAK